jgi:uncharacterized protein YndB with AHSA1/START domain
MSNPMMYKIRVLASAATVRHALTDPEAMRVWLAEHVEVDLPNRYEFWGRYTPEGDTARQRLLHVDDKSLRFSWQLSGKDSIVEIGLEAEAPESTVLTLTQTEVPGFEEIVRETSALALMHTYWALAFANLADYVEGREITAKCDFTSPVHREEVLIDAPPQKVYEALTTPEQFAKWFGANVGIELEVGGRFAMGGFDLDPDPAKIVDLVPGRSMSIAWPGQVSSWELADSDGKTRLTIVQSGFDEQNPPYGGWMGWLSGIAELRLYLERPDWRPRPIAAHLDGMPEGMLTI